MQRDKNENATLESYRDQYADIAEIKEAEAQKQLLLEYKPEVAKIKTDILDKTKPLRLLQEKELTDELLQLTKEQKAKLWLGNLENQEVAKELGLDPTKPIKITMNGDAIAHIEKRHGKDSVMVKNGQPPIETQDYFKQIEVVNKADKRKIVTEEGQKKLISGKQVNGYFIVVETISTKNNELKLKTMYKENGKLENSREFSASKDHRESGGYSLSPKPSVTLDSQMHPLVESVKLDTLSNRTDGRNGVTKTLLGEQDSTIKQEISKDTPQTKPYEVNENGRKYIEIPDDELADFEKPIKQALLLEPRQQELLKKNQCRFQRYRQLCRIYDK